MPNLEIIVTGNTKGATAELQKVQAELGRTAIAANKVDSSILKTGQTISATGNIAKQAAGQVAGLASGLVSGGLISAVTLAGVALFELGKKLFDVTEEQKRLGDALEGGKAAYIKATIEVYNLRTAFNQAENGIIRKETALKLYNDTLGKTLGKTKEFDEAEKSFIANASNYIKFTLLKAAANTALAKAAEQAFEIERNKQLGATKEGFFNTQNIISILGGGLSIQSDAARALQRLSEAQKGQNDYMKIYNALMQQANALGFNQVAIGDEQAKTDDKQTKAIKSKTEAQAEYNKLVRSGIQPQTTGESDPLSRGTGATLTPDIVVRPNLIIETDPAGLQTSFSKYSKKVIAAAEEFKGMVKEGIENTFTDTFSGIGDALGRALSGEKNAVPNLFGSLMSSVGTQIQELGKFLIKSAITVKIAKEAFQKLLANPLAAVAVGIGLVALGAILKSQASKQFKGFASGGTVGESGFYNVGERGQERVFLPQGAKVQPNNEVMAYGGGNSNMVIAETRISGPDLVILMRRGEAILGRNN